MNCYVLGANFEQGASAMITDSTPNATCSLCGKRSILISKGLGICLDCIRKAQGEALKHTNKAHERSRHEFNLPAFPPKAGEARCHFCANECRIAEGERGYCGLRENHEDKLRHLAGTRARGLVSWYHDPLPTNCVADWVCPGGSDTGYPEFSYSAGPEYGYKNLAVFYQACSFDCLFCQNWHFRQTNPRDRGHSAAELAQAVDPTTSCICHFGGDPSPQLAHALAASRIALAKNNDRVLRICWETNGSASRPLLDQMAALSLKSGGCIKFDLKTFDEKLNIALCGVSNRCTLENFTHLASLIPQRPEPPFLVASTLLVPGYVDAGEVSRIAKFIASLDSSIPYALLAFYPQFEMADLPSTSRHHAEACLAAAKGAGLTRVRVGNLQLLSGAY
jgi:pyruvate formate lyase activating enzyme